MRFLMMLIFISLPLMGRADTVTQFEKIYICVSFSMPKETLQAVFTQAQKYNAILVMRGFYKNSFQATRKKIEEIRINVLIDPNVFDDFKVTHVPTMIGIKEGVAYKISGNVSLGQALASMRCT